MITESLSRKHCRGTTQGLEHARLFTLYNGIVCSFGYALVCSGNFTYPSKVTHESRLIMMNYLLNIAMFIHFPCLSLITRGIQRVYSISKQTQSLPKGYTPWWYGCFLGVTASHRRLCCNFYSCLGSCYSVQLALPQAFGYGQRNLKRIPNR